MSHVTVDQAIGLCGVGSVDDLWRAGQHNANRCANGRVLYYRQHLLLRRPARFWRFVAGSQLPVKVPRLKTENHD